MLRFRIVAVKWRFSGQVDGYGDLLLEPTSKEAEPTKMAANRVVAEPLG
jgi:hypothetical protein